MAKYLLLFGAGRMPETDEERAQVMKAWDGWFSELGKAVADPGNPFTPAAKKVGTDGSIKDAQAANGGYTILEASSLDEAAKMATGCPVLQGGADITVLETFEVM